MASIVCGILLVTAAPAFASGRGAHDAEVFRAYAISQGGLQGGGTSAPRKAGTVDFVIERFSTESERSRLLESLKFGGRDELYHTFDAMEPVGRIKIPGRLGYDFKYAREFETGEGDRMLVLATSRPISLVELKEQARSRKCDISVVELILDREGNGSGTAMPAVRVDFDSETGDISLLDLNTLPIQLSRVQKIGPQG